MEILNGLKVVASSHKLLHWSHQSDRCLVSELIEVSSHVPAIKDCMAALASLQEASTIHSYCAFDRALRSFNQFLSSSAVQERPMMMLNVAFLMSQLSVSGVLCLLKFMLIFELEDESRLSVDKPN